MIKINLYKMFSLLLFLVTVLGVLPVTAYAEDDKLSVNSTEVTLENAANILAGTTNDGKVVYDPAADKLTVNAFDGNLAISGNGTVKVEINGGTDTAVNGNLTISNTSDVTVSTKSDSKTTVNGNVDIQNCIGDVKLTNQGYTVCVGKLTINGAKNVTVTSKASTNYYLAELTDITCTGNVNMENTGAGFAVRGNLSVKNASGVTVSTLSNGQGTVNGNVDIQNCTGDVKLTNQGYTVCVGKLTINGAKNVTVTSKASTNYYLAELTNITCTGNVNMENTGAGFAVRGNLSVKNASGVTVSTLSDGQGTVNGNVDIQNCTGDVKLTNQGYTVCVGKLTINGAKNVTVTSKASTNYYLAELTDITCTGNVNMENTGVGFAVRGNLSVKNASGVTVSTLSNGQGTVYGNADIQNCTGDVKFTNQGYTVCVGKLTVNGAKNVTVTSKASSSNYLVGLTDITCTGNVNMENTGGGYDVYGKLTVRNAADITVIAAASSGKKAVYGDVDVTSSGNVLIKNSGTEDGMLAYGGSIKYTRATGAGRYIVKTGDTETSLTSIAIKAENEIYSAETCSRKIFCICVPSASVADVTVGGTKNNAITSKDVVITLENDTFVSSLSGNWITNLPAGLTQSLTRTDDTHAKITVSGIPSEKSDAILSIIIPSSQLSCFDADVAVAENKKAVIDITGKNAQSALVLTCGTSVTYGNTITLETTGGTGTGAVTYEIISGGTGSATINGNILTPAKAGTVIVKAIKAEDDNYSQTESSPVTITIRKAAGKTLSSINISQKYTETTGTVTVGTADIPNDAGKLSFHKDGAACTTGSVTVENWNVDESTGKVTYELSGGSAGDTITLRLYIVCENYDGFSATIKITLISENYSVTVSEVQHGSVVSSKTKASCGETVTMTVTADRGYIIDNITVKDKNGKNISVATKHDGKTYTFVMPESDVEIDAGFIGKFILIPENKPNRPAVYDTLQEAVDNAESTDTIIANVSGEALAKGYKTFRVIQNYRAITKIIASKGYTIVIESEETGKGTLYRVSKDVEKVEIILGGIGGDSEEENPKTGAPVILLPVAVIPLVAIFKRK